jgi:hypothetical protein
MSSLPQLLSKRKLNAFDKNDIIQMGSDILNNYEKPGSKGIDPNKLSDLLSSQSNLPVKDTTPDRVGKGSTKFGN